MAEGLIMNKINVLQVCNKLDLGGTEKVLQLLTMHLNKDIFDVAVCGIQSGGERADLLQKLHYEVKILNRDSDRMVEFLKNRRIHIIHWHSSGLPEPFVLQAAQRASVPLVIRTNVFGQYDSSPESQLVDATIFVSKMCFLRYVRLHKCALKDFYRNNKVIYNPIEMSAIEQAVLSQEDSVKLKSEYGINSHEPVIGRIGRPDDSKFGMMGIEMMFYLAKLQPRIKYIVVGITEAKLRRIKQMGLLKHFIFIEPSVDSRKIYELYYIFDVHTHSATWGESFGCSIAEAMACKKPVVTHSTPHWDNAQIELVDHDSTGLVANNPRLYAKAVDFLLRSPEKVAQMGLAGYHKAASLYDVKHIVGQVEKLYLDKLKEKGFKLDDRLHDYRLARDYYPSFKELQDFFIDYQERLKKSFGRQTFYEHIQHMGREVLIYGKSLIHSL
jgi:glycosyltransferase involved in cell wall biosynthesis